MALQARKRRSGKAVDGVEALREQHS